MALTSCSDFFEQESENVIYTDKNSLNHWSDTVSSVMGIFNKMQVIADRTILLGEVRGDLVTLTANASADLRELASFTIDDDNVYNQPRDYYAIINNCNYFIAHADTALKSNRNEYIFMKEFAAVKAIRAWTYLQLVLNYGSVPFITEPILTKDMAEQNYPRYELADICQYFLDDLAQLPTRYDNEYPSYGSVRGNDSRFFFFPINILRGDLNLWLGSVKGKEAGKENFKQAALCYYSYISQRNGENTAYPTGYGALMWAPGNSSWNAIRVGGDMSSTFSETWKNDSELISMIPGDSIRAEGYYSELRNLFNSTTENNDKFSIKPSNRIIEISAAQPNCCLSSNGLTANYAPEDLSDHRSGDLRLYYNWSEGTTVDDITGLRTETQRINKYNSKNVHVYRRMMVYMRMAEALNLSGYPLIAYKILETGLSNDVLYNEVYPYLSQGDKEWLNVSDEFTLVDSLLQYNVDTDIKPTFDFPNNLYAVLTAGNVVTNTYSTCNTIGIHSRGSGYTPYNEYYDLDYENMLCWYLTPDSTLAFDNNAYEQIKAIHQAQVEQMLLDEEALEFAFEGQRYYDLMRFAMRSDNPGEFMTSYINRRNGQDADAGINLSNPHSWYMRWGNGKIGY
jgi:hypothetical protein